jgi:prepilin-type N-terminal cleavage/methylation domain-containing protein
MKNKVSRGTGFTLVEIMIVVAIIGMLASIAIPNFLRARREAQTSACINNLRCIDNAKQQWALELRQQDTATPTGGDLQPYLGRTATGSLPSCPADAVQTFATSYDPQSVGAKPVCLIIPASHILP